MGKRPSLVYQCKERLKDMQRFGCSKKEEREKLREYAKANNIPISNLAVPGIYSKETFNTYKEQNCRFVKWTKENHPEVKQLDDCKKYAKEYLELCEKRGDSAWSLHTYTSAIAKLYSCRSKELGYQPPARRSDERIRSQYSTKRDKMVEKRNAEVIEIMKNTGMRRCEMEKLEKHQISDDYKTITLKGRSEETNELLTGKGGRPRVIEVLDPEGFRAYIESHPRDDCKAFGKLDSHIDIHGYRHDYAQRFYETKLKEKYESGQKTEKWYIRRDGSNRRYDKEIMQEISRSLGHERVDQTIANYLK